MMPSSSPTSGPRRAAGPGGRVSVEQQPVPEDKKQVHPERDVASTLSAPAASPGAAGVTARITRRGSGHLTGGRPWPPPLPPAWWAALAGLGLGLLALGPALARGFVLTYDMVFVPKPPFTSALLGLTGGAARPVPSDAVVAVAALLVPADILQKLILLSVFVLACSGAAALLADGWQARTGQRAPLLACLAAGVFYTWNPYVAERLVMGQWATLLGYAGLPWVMRLLCTGPERIGRTRLVLTLLPAAIGGFAGMTITALAAAPAALARGRERGRRGPARRRRGRLPAAEPALDHPVTDRAGSRGPRRREPLRGQGGHAVRGARQPGGAVGHLERPGGAARLRRPPGHVLAGRGRLGRGRRRAARPAGPAGARTRRRRADRARGGRARRERAGPRGAARPDLGVGGLRGAARRPTVRGGARAGRGDRPRRRRRLGSAGYPLTPGPGRASGAIVRGRGVAGYSPPKPPGRWTPEGASEARRLAWPPSSRRSCCCPGWRGDRPGGCTRCGTRRTG